MKILFLNQFFWPDSSATSQQLTDLATGLAEMGNEVYVVCGDGGYAENAVGDAPPVHIHRVKSLPFVRGKVGRMLSYLTFYLSAVVRGLTLPRADVVVSLTTPPVISLLGSIIKIVRGSRHYIWEQDIYPDVAIDLKYINAGGMADRITGLFADFSRNHADGIIALGECMKERLLRRGITPSKITVAENWANGDAIKPLERGGNPDQLVVLYSGNLGLAHDTDTIAGAMRNLREDQRFRFLFVGGGGRRKELAKFCELNNIDSLEMRPYVPRDQLSEGLSLGDIGLVTQHDVCSGTVVPSKVYGIMAAGRPILFIGPKTATPALTIERHNCGWHIDCGDITSLTNLLLLLADRPGMVQAAGVRARQALLDRYDLPIAVRRMASILGADDVDKATELEPPFTRDGSSPLRVSEHDGGKVPPGDPCSQF